MSIEVWFKMAPNWEQSNFPSKGEYIVCDIVIKWNIMEQSKQKWLVCATIWINLTGMIMNKSRQARKSIYCIILFIGNQEQIKLIDDHRNHVSG